MAKTNLSVLLKLLSVACEPPSAEWVGTLVSGNLAQGIHDAWVANELPAQAADDFATALAAYKDTDAEEVLHELRQDWSHMYLGETPLVTNSEGLWRKKAEGKINAVRMINSYTTEVADFMRECGVKRQKSYNDCIDHLEEEFDFCSFLATSPAYLVEMGRDPLALLERFIDEHLKLWLPGYAADVIEHARSAYYQALGALLASFAEAL